MASKLSKAPNRFRSNTKVDVSQAYFKTLFKDIPITFFMKRFPKAIDLEHPRYEPDNGFTEPELKFVNTTTKSVFHVYSKWEVVRVASNTTSEKELNSFINWLLHAKR